MIRKGTREYKLKAAISHLINENQTLCDLINNTEKPSKRFILTIDSQGQSMGSKTNGHIILGTGNISFLYNICKVVTKKYGIKSHLKKNFYEYVNINNISIDDSLSYQSTFHNTSFLETETPTSADTLTIFAIAYTLYHEFGHVKYDDETKNKLYNEKQADFYANKLLRNMSMEDFVENEISLRFMGAMLETIQILFISKFENVEVSNSHPHPIERIYNLLEFFHVTSDSCLWDFAYYIVDKWIIEQKLGNAFLKKESLSGKDKFLDAYLRFKK